MNRLVLLLALAATGTGCVVSDTCETRTVSVGWSSFLLANGGVTTSCATAGATSVDVWMDGDGFVGSFACTAGGVDVTSVLAGSHTYTVEPKDFQGRIILRDYASSSGDGCGTLFVDTQPAEGTFELAYSFTPNNVCTPGGSYIWFSLYDETAAQESVVYEDATWACGDDIRFALPIGPWTLERTEEVTYDGTYHAAARNCSASGFTVPAASLVSVPSAMADSASFCP